MIKVALISIAVVLGLFGGQCPQATADELALALDGTNGLATAATAIYPDSSVLRSFTVEAWIFPTASDSFIVADDTYYLALLSPISPGGPLGVSFTVYNSAGGSSITDYRELRLNEWNHVAAMFDASAKRLKLLLNGVPSSNPVPFAGNEFLTGSGTAFSVGGISPEVGAFFKGFVDEVRVSDIVRYPGTTNTAPDCRFSTDANARGLWHFDESSGSTNFADSTVSGNQLTGKNGAQAGGLSVKTPIIFLTPAGGAAFSGSSNAGSIRILGSTGCPWTAGKNASWINFTSSTNGDGNGLLSYNVAANPGCSLRTGSITVGNRSFTVVQNGSPASYVLAPLSATYSAAGGSGSISISSGGGCAWSASKSVAWITFVSATNGTGTGSVSYAVATNLDCLPRSGSVSIGGQPFTVNQAAGTGSYSLSTAGALFGPAGGAGSVGMIAGNGCPWNVLNVADWITTAPSNGTGSGSIAYFVRPHHLATPRTASLVIASQVHAVTQAGNDNFTNRFPLGGGIIVTNGSTQGATRELAEPLHGAQTAGASAWWTWTAPSNGIVTLSTYGSQFDTVLAVYNGSSLDTLSRVAMDDDGGGELASRVHFAAVGGTSYHFAVDGFADGVGEVALNLWLLQPGSPPLIPTGSTLPSGRVGDSYSVTLQEASLGAALNWSIVSGALPPGLSLDLLTATITGRPLLSGTFGFRVRLNETNNLATEKTFSLTINPAASPPANDSFATPGLLNGLIVAASGSNLGATREPGEPLHANQNGARSLWWTWTAPASGAVMANTRGSLIDTLLAVYTGSSVSALTSIVSNDDGYPGELTSQVVFNAVVGTVYHIAVDGYEGDAGEVKLAVLTQDALPNFQSIRRLNNGQVQLELRTTTGKTNYLIERSEDLAGWTLLTSLSSTNPIIQFIDSSSTNSQQRFYRAVIP